MQMLKTRTRARKKIRIEFLDRNEKTLNQTSLSPNKINYADISNNARLFPLYEFREKFYTKYSRMRAEILGSAVNVILYMLFIYMAYKNIGANEVNKYAEEETIMEEDGENVNKVRINIPFSILRKGVVNHNILYNPKKLEDFSGIIKFLSEVSLRITDENKDYYKEKGLFKQTVSEDKYKDEHVDLLYTIDFVYAAIVDDTKKELSLVVDKTVLECILDHKFGYTRYVWQDIAKLNNYTHILLYLSMIKTYKLNNGSYTIKVDNLINMLGIQLSDSYTSPECRRKDYIHQKVILPFITQLKKKQVEILDIKSFNFYRNADGEYVLNIDYTVKLDKVFNIKKSSECEDYTNLSSDNTTQVNTTQEEEKIKTKLNKVSEEQSEQLKQEQPKQEVNTEEEEYVTIIADNGQEVTLPKELAGDTTDTKNKDEEDDIYSSKYNLVWSNDKETKKQRIERIYKNVCSILEVHKGKEEEDKIVLSFNEFKKLYKSSSYYNKPEEILYKRIKKLAEDIIADKSIHNPTGYFKSAFTGDWTITKRKNKNKNNNQSKVNENALALDGVETEL